MGKLVKFITVIPFVFVFIAILHVSVWFWLANTTNEVKHTDIIVVFPGSPPDRIAVGYKLASEGYASNLAVINLNLQQLEWVIKKRGSLPEVNAVSSGKSRSTFEDVFNAKKILQEHKFKSMLLVTSSYHLPRAYFLLKVFLLGSDVDLSVYHIPIERDGKIDAGIKTKLYLNEIVKLWGSTIEMVGYQLSGRLLLDTPTFWQVRQFLKKNFLFQVK